MGLQCLHQGSKTHFSLTMSIILKKRHQIIDIYFYCNFFQFLWLFVTHICNNSLGLHLKICIIFSPFVSSSLKPTLFALKVQWTLQFFFSFSPSITVWGNGLLKASIISNLTMFYQNSDLNISSKGVAVRGKKSSY